MVDYKKTIFKLLGFIAIVLGVLGVIFLGAFFWPFLIAIIIALSLENVINFIVKRARLPRKLTGMVLVFLTYAIIGFIVYLLISKLIKEAVVISGNIPEFYDYMVTTYKSLYMKYIAFTQNIPEVMSDRIYDTGIKLLEVATTFASNFFNGVLNFIMFVPSILIYIIVTFLATLFLVVDRRAIARYVQDILPKNIVKKSANILQSTLKSLGQYLRAQLTIICITFIELFIAFTIIKQPYPLTFALVIALIDALPILGTGTVLVPWALYSVVIGNMPFAIALAITYLVILIVRQLIEPKIVSNQLGVHPFLTLVAMYIGFKIFGLVGMIIGPIVMVIFKNVFSHLFEAGYFKNFIVYVDKHKGE